MFTPKGKFAWYELMTSDTEAAGKFYSDVVGWTTKAMPSPDGSQYTTFNLGEVGMAGMLHLPQHTGWIGYIAVDDVDAHCAQARTRGALIVEEPATHDYGQDHWSDRSYGALDPEGHLWWVTQRVRNPPGN